MPWRTWHGRIIACAVFDRHVSSWPVNDRDHVDLVVIASIISPLMIECVSISELLCESLTAAAARRADRDLWDGGEQWIDARAMHRQLSR